MINRILIRIKVIQILYSFMLVEKQFSLERSLTATTKEKRFANALYIDMIVLMVRLAEYMKTDLRDSSLVSSRFISRLLIDETVKSALRSSRENSPFNSVIPDLAERIKASALYKNFRKDSDRNDKSVESDFWQNIFKYVIMPDPAVKAMMEGMENYTPKGVERVEGMIERTFVNFLTAHDNVRETEEALDKSMAEARDLYLKLICMPVEITDLQERILDDNRHKFLRTEEDMNPNLRFVENRMVRALRENPKVENYLAGNSEKKSAPWAEEDPILFRNLLEIVLSSDVYADYMAASEVNLADDCEFWRNILKHVILPNEKFLQAMEDKSVFWNDDVDIISTFVMKSFRRIADGKEPVLAKFKDEEDAAFGRELVRYLYKNKDAYRLYINEALDTGKWDKDRLAFMDIVIMMTALAEIMNFPKIPVQASLNEYIEIAKSYSSPRSGSFVNGILGSVINRLRAEGKLLK